MLGKYLNPQNDIAFKRLFGTEKNKDILISLLNEVLGNQLESPIKDVSYLPAVQPPEIISKKTSIVDVLCMDELGVQYIIEMQVADKDDFTSRAQYYASKTFISQMNVGGKYRDLKEVIFLAFCNYTIFKNKKAYKSEHVTLDKNTGERDLDKLSFTFIELKKFDRQRKQDIDKLSKEEKFYYFLANVDGLTPEQLEALTKKNKVMEKAYSELNRAYWSDAELIRYDREEKRNLDSIAEVDAGIAKGKAEGLKEGEAKGIAKGIVKGRAEGLEEGEAKGKAEGKKEILEELVKAGLISKSDAEKRLKNS